MVLIPRQIAETDNANTVHKEIDNIIPDKQVIEVLTIELLKLTIILYLMPWGTGYLDCDVNKDITVNR